MANVRLYQDYASAGDYTREKKEQQIIKRLTGKATTTIEPSFLSLWGKNVNMKINYFFPKTIETYKEKNGEKIKEMKDFIFCSLSFKNCTKEHWLVVNKTFQHCLVENGLAEYDEHENQIDYVFEELEGKMINGYAYCESNGKGKKLFGTLASLEQYVAYLKELEEKKAEEEREELKD